MLYQTKSDNLNPFGEHLKEEDLTPGNQRATPLIYP